MAQNISQQVLEDFTATITKKPNVSRQKILEAFPEFNNDSALLDAAYDYAETRRMNPYEDIQTINSKFPEFFGGTVEQPAQPAEQPKQPSLLQSIGAHNPYPIQPANPLKAETWDIDKQNRERLDRIKSATLPMSDEDKQREAEIERLGKEGAFGTPNGISITYDKRTGSPIITRTKSDGAHLYTGVNANQSEIDRLINERPDYMRTPHSEEDIVDNIERAWMTNTENGQKAIADAEQRIKDFIASCQENFKYTQQAQQITQALQSGQIDEQQAQQYADSAFNELYGEVIMQQVQEEKDAFKQAALADNQDYYLKAKRDLQYAATHKVTADAHKQIDNLLKNESAPSVMQLAHSGGQMMRDPYIHAAQNFLYKSEQRMNDMRLDKYEAGDFAKNVAYDLGGILESTATFGLSDLADRSTVTSIFKKVADAASKAKDPDEIYNNPELVLNDKERAVYTAYTAMISAEMARLLDTSYWADAAKLTADMIPFMLEVGAMNGIFGGINRAAQEGISRGLTRSIVGKLPAGAKKTAAKMFTGAITDIAGAGLYAGESAVMSLALPRTYANMLQKEIDVDYNALKVDNDNLVIGGFDTKSTPEAFMTAWRDQWKEMFTETGGLFNVGANVLFNNPIAKRAFYGIKRSNLGGLIDMFNTGKFFDFAKQVGYHGTYKEWLEEVEGTCWDYAFGDKDAFANFFSRDTQIPMLISFTVPAVLGGGINAGREIKYRMQFKNATNNILNTIKSHGFTDEDFADIKKSLYATPVEDLPATIANMAAALTETEQFGNMYKDYAFYSNKAKYGKLSPEEQQRLDVAAAYLFDSNNAQTEEAKALAAELTKLAYAEVALSAFDKDIANDRRRAYNEAVSFYREQTAEIAQEEQAQEQSVPTPYEQNVQDVTRTVNNLAFRNGGELTDDTPVFRVSLNGQEGKQGYVVSGESLPELDATGKMFTNNPLMTIKWDDDTVTQHTLNELVLLGVSTAGQRIAQEVEARNDERAVEKIAEGEKPVVMTRGNEVLVLFRKGNGILVDEHDQEYVDTKLFQDGWKLTEDKEERHPNDASGVIPMTQGASSSMKPAAPNIDTMSADEYVRAIVEDRYKGNRTKAQAIISAKLNGAKTDLQVTQKEFDKFQKKGLTSSMNEEQWEAQYDKYEQQIKGLTALVSKLEAANIAVVHYKTQAELQEEAERKAREAAMREQRRQLGEAEAAGDIEAKWQNTKKTVGFAATKTLPNGQKVNGRYILTEAGDVIPSHDPRKNYADSDGYVMENGQNVNDNNYKDQEVQKIAIDIAQNYGGQAVEQMPFLENRAGRVLSGNNRTISGIIAAENNTDQAYLAALAENAQQYGFTPEQLAEYQHPRLQFVVEDELPFTTGTFAMFNQQEKKTKSSVNRAVANSKMVTEAVRDRMLEIMDQYESLDSFFGSESAAGDVINTLIQEGLMTQQEVAGLTEKTDKGFKFNQSGKEYVTDMLLGTLFDEETIRMLAGEKTLKQAIFRALPSIVENRRLKGYELTESVNQAIKLLYEARKANEGKSTSDAFQLYMRQVDAFEGAVGDRYSEFDIILAGRMSAGVEQLRELLGMYNNSARNEANGQIGLFEPRTADQIKQDVYEYYTRQDPELAAAINGAATRVEEPQSAVPSGTTNEGETRQGLTNGEQALEAAKAENQQENLQDSKKSSTFAPSTSAKTWTDKEFSSLILSEEEKIELLNQIDDGQTPIIVVNNATFAQALAKEGASRDEQDRINWYISKGLQVNGVKFNGKAFINTDAVRTGSEVVKAYVHERQHLLTMQDPSLIRAIIDHAAPEELARVINAISNTDQYNIYLKQGKSGHIELADEFISHIMQEVYALGGEADVIAQIYDIDNPDILNTLNKLDNEQRNDGNLAKARRYALIGTRTQGAGGQDEGNSQPRPGGDLEQQGLRSTGNSNQGTGSRGQAAGQQPNLKPSTSAADIETGGALVDQLERMGVEVSTDLAANNEALKKAKKDKSEEGKIHYYKTQSGQQYGFSYKGKVYLDPRKVDANLPLHEYGHLWCDAFRRLNPEGWQSVIETIKADADSWNFIKQLRPELKTDDEIAVEVIATFSGKRGSEKLKAELQRMAAKDPNYKSKWQNIFKNISKAIQDFWKAVGDFLHIQYTSAEQVYDQVLKDFVDNMNPRKRIEQFLQDRNDAYLRAVDANDSETATAIFNEALRENIGNGITPYVSVGNYNQLKRLAKGVKTRDPKIIQEAAELIAPLIPENAVLIPAPSHTGRATDMLDLANALAEITKAEVADILQSAPRESQYQKKKATGVPMSSKNLGITLNGVVPDGKLPVVIDNVVDSGNTAEACVQALGKGVVVSLANSAPAYGHAATLKSASPVLRDKNGNVIPLDKRFDLEGSKYLGRIAKEDIRFAINGTGLVKLDGKTLVGLHNINEDKLRKILKAGGLANPSAAVIDLARQDHTDYGDISLVLSNGMVENADGTYAGDAWTPMYPHVEYRLGKDTIKKIDKLVDGLPENIAYGIKRGIDDYMAENRRTSGLEYLFLKNKGVDVPMYLEPRRYPNISVKEIDDRIGATEDERNNQNPFEAYERLPQDQLFELNLWLEKYGKPEEIQRVKDMIARLQSEGKDQAANTLIERYSEPMFFNAFDSVYHRVMRDERDAGSENVGRTLEDAYRKIDELGYRDEFDEWLRKTIDDLGYDEVLFSHWTSDGSRRYVPNTVDNASRLMNRQNQTNYLDRQSVNETKAMLMDKMRTLDEIRKHKDLLEPSHEKYLAAYEEVSKDWGQLGIDFRDYTTNEDKTAYGLDDNKFIAIDNALARLQEAMSKRDPIAYLNREYRYSLPADSEFGKRLKDITKRIKNLPSRYFETKFRRPVYLNEFAAAVVPNDLPQDLRDGLQQSGLTLFGYDPSTAGSRRDATLKATEADGIRFSISGRKPTGTIAIQPGENRVQYAKRISETIKDMTPRNTSLDDAIRFSITVNHNSPYLLKKADGSFIDPETGERLGFDHRFMGKGEGGQAHGWGSYFSVNDIRSYAEGTSLTLPTYKGQTIYKMPKSRETMAARLILDQGVPRGFVRASFEKLKDEIIRKVRAQEDAAWLRRGLEWDDAVKETDAYYEDPIKWMNDMEAEIRALKEEDFYLPFRHHYTVDIPDNDGTNYIEESGTNVLDSREIVRSIYDRLGEKQYNKWNKFVGYENSNSSRTPNSGYQAYKAMQNLLGSAEEASKFFHDLGFVGIHYDGRSDGECYVIFDENDAVITGHIRFSVSKNANNSDNNLDIREKNRNFAAKFLRHGERPNENRSEGERLSESNGSGVLGEAAGRLAATADRSAIRVYEPQAQPADRVGHFLDLPRTVAREATEAESERLIAAAKANGQFVERKDWGQYGEKKNGITRESTVFQDHDQNRHIKVKDPFALAVIKGNYPEDAIYEHLIHNLLFPDTRYTFLGMSEDWGDVRFILSQETVDAVRNATDKEVEDYMRRLGLRKTDDYSYENDWVRVTDVTGDNVLVDKDGNVRFIDPVIGLKVPARQILDEVESFNEVKVGGFNEGEASSFDEVKAPQTDWEKEEDQIRFSIVNSRKKIAELEAGEKIKLYRAMAQIDGKLYPPMSSKDNETGKLRQPIELGRWEQSEERPDLTKEIDGKWYFTLKKDDGKSVDNVAYNPYFHTSRTPLNDQFTSAYNRGNLVIVETEVPTSELTSGYKADKAHKAVGEMSWHSGPVSSQLPAVRKVVLTRWDKPVRVVPDEEVAQAIAEMLKGTDAAIPWNVVTPSLLAELDKLNVPITVGSGTGYKGKPRPNNDIRFAITSTSGQNKNRSEVITEALVKQANNNYGIMQAALKKVMQDLKGIRAAMRLQSDYDRKVVDSLLNLYNTLLYENGAWSQYMPDTSRRIATQIIHAIGKQNIRNEVNTIMDHMVHAQAKAAQRQWDKLRQTPIDKINISGVVMQGKVALEGQHALKAMNDALQANMTIEQIEEHINQLMDMEDNTTDESLKTQYKGQWIGYTIAAQHLDRLQHLQEERLQLDLELQSARSNKALKPAARQQLVDNIKQAMRDNYIEQAEAYTRSTQDLSEYVNTQEERAKDFIRRQDANRNKIRSYAQRDLEGVATNPNRLRTRGNVVRSIWDAFASPIRDLQSLLRLCGMHAPDGEGYLYNHFMRNWMDGADKERLGIVNASKTLDEKISELTHGKYKTWEEAARKIDDASHNMFTITMLNGVDGKDQPVTEDIPLNAGNALYIYAVNKMNDGRMKLNGRNITEEDVQALADQVREQFGQEILDVVDWVQSEFFPQLRNRYNPTHEALFGAPMDAIENYFPLRINANDRQQNEDLSEPDTDAARLLAGTSTGAIKRRTKNSLPLDVRNADFFQEVIRHISQMERWNAFAQWNRDANILFSDINFRNRIKGMNGTIYGSGDKLYNYMKDAFRVAIGTYKPKTDTFSEITLNMAKGVTSAKINFRIFTALKQIASFPAFFTYMTDGKFVQSYLRNWVTPHSTMKWANENLPNFEKRVSKRDMGDMRLMQRSTDWQWNKRILEWSSKYGMFFNVLFDTLTCATGARAVYDSHLADYLNKGYSEEDARNRARQDAEQAFNTSQQSSEGAFMSAVQQDRNLVTAALTVFRTSPIQYTRNFFYHTRNLLRKFGRGTKAEQIAFRTAQYKNDGLNNEQATAAATKDYNKSIARDVIGFVVYGALLNILWRLAGQAPYLLFGDDDDKKKEIFEDATSGGAWFSPFTGLLGGGIVESALDGNGSVADMFAPEMPFTQDVKRAGQYLKNDKYAEFASQALSVLMQSGTGFDPQTAADMITRVVTTIDSEQELSVAEEALRISQALLSIPQSQYEQQLIDRVVAGDSEYDAALEDYIRNQKIHTAPVTWWMRGEESDEKAEENAVERFDRLLNERDALHNPEEE